MNTLLYDTQMASPLRSADEYSLVDRQAVERLKIACLTQGVAVGPAVMASMGGPAALTVHEYATTGGIALRAAGVYINAPFDDPQCPSSPVSMVQTGEDYALEYGDLSFAVETVLPLPGYLQRRLSTGRLASDVVMSHCDRIRLSPIKGCAYNCAFCDLGEMRYERREQSELEEALDLALADTALPARHVLISGGSPGPRHAEWFNNLCARLIAYSPLPVDVMFSPQHLAEKTIDVMADAGVNSVSINLELFSENGAQAHLPQKRRHSYEFFEPTIVRAVERLGRSGRVRSLIIPGLESEAETIAGIEFLAGLGVHPVLSPFRPARGTRLAAEPPVAAESLVRILDAGREIVARHGVALGPGCVPCQHNTLTFPWDGTGVNEFPE
jgi:pyruvate-formate lyase-activating enzyme